MLQTALNEPTRVEITLEHLVCGGCGCIFAMPSVVLRAKREHREPWYCPNGHACSDDGGEAVIDVRQELLQARQRLSHLGAGTCPYCKKTFKRLDRHLTWKHQEEQLRG
jgi:hypothetical protein